LEFHGNDSFRVLILVPCLLVGGTEMQTLALARALLGGGYHVTVCAYYEYDRNMVEAFERSGVRVLLLGLPRNVKGHNLGRMPKLAWALSRIIHQERPELVHVQYMAPGLLPLLTARMLGVPHILATVHTPGSVYGKRVWFIRNVVARLCDAFICVSETAEASFFGDSAIFAEQLLANGRKHFAIPNAVDLTQTDTLISHADIAELRRSLGLDGHVVVGMVSRLSREKGPQYLLEAMVSVVRQVPTAKLLMVGDGADRDSLGQQARRLGITEQIVWVGRLLRDEAMRRMAVMDIVAVPSEFEGFGLTAAEAMALGKPVVASDVAGLREVVEDKATGFLVPVGDVSALATAITRLLQDAAMRQCLGKAGRRRVEERFSMPVFADRYLRLYRSLLEAKPCL